MPLEKPSGLRKQILMAKRKRALPDLGQEELF